MCTLLGARRLSDVPLKKRGGKSTFKGTDPEQKIFYQLTRIKTATPDRSCIYQQHAGVLTLSPSLCIVVSTLAKTESVSTVAQTAVRRKTISFLAPLHFARATGRKNEQQIAATNSETCEKQEMSGCAFPAPRLPILSCTPERVCVKPGRHKVDAASPPETPRGTWRAKGASSCPPCPLLCACQSVTCFGSHIVRGLNAPGGRRGLND